MPSSTVELKMKTLVETSGALASEASESCKHRHRYVGEIHLESSGSGAVGVRGVGRVFAVYRRVGGIGSLLRAIPG